MDAVRFWPPISFSDAYRHLGMGRSYPTLMRQCSWRSIYALCAIVCLIVTGEAHGAEAGRVKRVLLIATGSRFSPGFAMVDQAVLQALAKSESGPGDVCTEDQDITPFPVARASRFSPGFARVDQAILQALAKSESGPVDVYPENLDILRFPTERFARIFSEYLAEKYSEQPPDLIVFVYIGNLGTAAKFLQQLFPTTPLVVAGFTEEEVPRDQFGSLVSGIAQRVDPRATIELILRLQPETRRIIVIGGTAEVDRNVFDRVKEAARSFAGRVDFQFWNNQRMTELPQSVSALP